MPMTQARESIPRRRLDFLFDPASVPRDYYAHDEALSLVLTALSLVFPDGERFFVESVVRYQRDVNDPELLEAIKAFAAQEGMHSRAHLAFNALVAAQGLSLAPRLSRQAKALLSLGRKTHGPAGRLAITCALEHFTAVLAEQLLTFDEHREAFSPDVQPLWMWHALEELEHKSVAFDVYQQVDGSYPRRAAVMALATVFFMGFITYAHTRLLAERNLLADPRHILRTARYLWGKPGLFRRLIPAYLDYYRPGFHPDDRDTTALLEQFRDRLFGERGVLRDALEQAAPRREAA